MDSYHSDQELDKIINY